MMLYENLHHLSRIFSHFTYHYQGPNVRSDGKIGETEARVRIPHCLTKWDEHESDMLCEIRHAGRQFQLCIPLRSRKVETHLDYAESEDLSAE